MHLVRVDYLYKVELTHQRMTPEYLESLRKNIIKRKETLELLFSKIELKDKLSSEIKVLENEVIELDKRITIWTCKK